MYSQRKCKYANNVLYWEREGAIQGNLIKNALLVEGQGWPGQRNCYATSQVAQESGVTSRQHIYISGFLEIYQDSLKTQLEVFHCFWRGAIELATFTLQSEVTWIGFFSLNRDLYLLYFVTVSVNSASHVESDISASDSHRFHMLDWIRYVSDFLECNSKQLWLHSRFNEAKQEAGKQ